MTKALYEQRKQLRHVVQENGTYTGCEKQFNDVCIPNANNYAKMTQKTEQYH